MENKIVPLTNLIDLKNHGHILYTYNKLDNYIENAISYIVSGIEQGHHIIFIESNDTYEKNERHIKRDVDAGCS
ncbi:Uncharacterised protein [Mycobacteroides abscessus subsp. abscessus]|nr:Uncharacterised protein [Mycobacteroides abscessus subsp. abscessus]